jgi:hypothetical protein
VAAGFAAGCTAATWASSSRDALGRFRDEPGVRDVAPDCPCSRSLTGEGLRCPRWSAVSTLREPLGVRNLAAAGLATGDEDAVSRATDVAAAPPPREALVPKDAGVKPANIVRELWL